MFTIIVVDERNMVKLKPWVPEESAETVKGGNAASAEPQETLECLLATYEIKKTAGVNVRHPG